MSNLDMYLEFLADADSEHDVETYWKTLQFNLLFLDDEE